MCAAHALEFAANLCAVCAPGGCPEGGLQLSLLLRPRAHVVKRHSLSTLGATLLVLAFSTTSSGWSTEDVTCTAQQRRLVEL